MNGTFSRTFVHAMNLWNLVKIGAQVFLVLVIMRERAKRENERPVRGTEGMKRNILWSKRAGGGRGGQAADSVMYTTDWRKDKDIGTRRTEGRNVAATEKAARKWGRSETRDSGMRPWKGRRCGARSWEESERRSSGGSLSEREKSLKGHPEVPSERKGLSREVETYIFREAIETAQCDGTTLLPLPTPGPHLRPDHGASALGTTGTRRGTWGENRRRLAG